MFTAGRYCFEYQPHGTGKTVFRDIPSSNCRKPGQKKTKNNKTGTAGILETKQNNALFLVFGRHFTPAHSGHSPLTMIQAPGLQADSRYEKYTNRYPKGLPGTRTEVDKTKKKEKSGVLMGTLVVAHAGHSAHATHTAHSTGRHTGTACRLG